MPAPSLTARGPAVRAATAAIGMVAAVPPSPSTPATLHAPLRGLGPLRARAAARALPARRARRADLRDGGRRPGGVVREQVALPRALRRRGADVVHAPNCFLPLRRPVPGRGDGPRPRLRGPPRGLRAHAPARSTAASRRARRARRERVICVSRFTRRRRLRALRGRRGERARRAQRAGAADRRRAGRRAATTCSPSATCAARRTCDRLVRARGGRRGSSTGWCIAGADAGEGRRCAAGGVELPGYVDDAALDALMRGADAARAPVALRGLRPRRRSRRWRAARRSPCARRDRAARDRRRRRRAVRPARRRRHAPRRSCGALGRPRRARPRAAARAPPSSRGSARRARDRRTSTAEARGVTTHDPRAQRRRGAAARATRCPARSRQPDADVVVVDNACTDAHARGRRARTARARLRSPRRLSYAAAINARPIARDRARRGPAPQRRLRPRRRASWPPRARALDAEPGVGSRRAAAPARDRPEPGDGLDELDAAGHDRSTAGARTALVGHGEPAAPRTRARRGLRRRRRLRAVPPRGRSRTAPSAPRSSTRTWRCGPPTPTSPGARAARGWRCVYEPRGRRPPRALLLADHARAASARAPAPAVPQPAADDRSRTRPRRGLAARPAVDRRLRGRSRSATPCCASATLLRGYVDAPTCLRPPRVPASAADRRTSG